MAKITRIKASDAPLDKATPKNAHVTRRHAAEPEPVAEKGKKGKKPQQDKKQQKSKSGKKPFILFRPFVALGHYLRDAWGELRQVRWPNRKTTWKMVLAVLVYSALFMGLILLLDLIFTSLFNLIFS